MRTSVRLASGALEPPDLVGDMPPPMPGPLMTIRRWLRAHMTDEWAVALLAMILSIGFFAWYDAHGLTHAFNDAKVRELIARRVVMSRTPGLGQLGSTWLPLPFMLMLPLIWIRTLFRDGLASSLPSMLAYVIAAVYIYRIARLLTSSRAAGWVAAAALMLNPSLLYIQGTAMSETASLSAFIIAIYYALQLTRTHHATDIVKCAAAAAAGTLIRYENWVFAIALLPLLLYAAWRRRGYLLAESWAILYGLLAFAGCAAWILYNFVIFHDPFLSFFYGNRSHTFMSHVPLPAHHHALFALIVYGLTVAETVGWALIPLAIVGLAIFALRNRFRETTLPAYLFLVPFAFYWLVLYRGVNTESLGIPGLGVGSLYNVRFGLLMIPAAALFLSCLTTAGPVILRRTLVGVTLAVILVSSTLDTIRTPIVVREAVYGAAGARVGVDGRNDANWLTSHYHGGNILITYVNSQSMIFYLLTSHSFSDRSLITDANGPQFTGALAQPQRWVTWIVMDSDVTNGKSQIWADLHGRLDWRRYFVLRRTTGTTQIYERRRTVSADGLQGRAADAQTAQARATVHPNATPRALVPISAHGFDETNVGRRRGD
jgi:Dolichyl-phosphate-mannose-protein mannosyltransferase